MDVLIICAVLAFLLVLAGYLFTPSYDSYPQRNTLRQYGHLSETNNGEIVRSNSERVIADYFSSLNIRYEYERKIRGIGKPDFYLPDYDVYVEYWGLVDADDYSVKNEYVKTMKWKMAQYHSRNIKFISIYPRNMNNLDWIFKKKFENVTGKKLYLTNSENNGSVAETQLPPHTLTDYLV